LDIEQLKRFNVLIDHYKTLLEEVETRIDKLVPFDKKGGLNELFKAIDNLNTILIFTS